MGTEERPLDGGEEDIRNTGNGPEDPRETLILQELFGDPDGGGVYGGPLPVGEEE